MAVASMVNRQVFANVTVKVHESAFLDNIPENTSLPSRLCNNEKHTEEHGSSKRGIGCF